jgi:nitrite reductase/ring-hydroxylating ferredoxin subunit
MTDLVPGADRAEIRIGEVEDFPVGRMRIVLAGTLEIGVIRHADGTFHAMRNRCPHRGAPLCLGRVSGTMLPSAPGELAYGLDHMVVRCPWHGYEFDIATGRGLFGNAGMRLRTYPVALRDGAAHVTLRRASAGTGAEGDQS